MKKTEYIKTIYKKTNHSYSPSLSSRGKSVLRGDIITNGKVEYFTMDSSRFIGVSSYYSDLDKKSIVIEYIEFITSEAVDGNSLNPFIRVVDNNGIGMKLSQGSKPLFSCKMDIKYDSTRVSDPKHDRTLAIANLVEVPVSFLADLIIPADEIFKKIGDEAAESIAEFAFGMVCDASISGVKGVFVNLIAADKGGEGILTADTNYSIQNGCVFSKIGDRVDLHCSGLTNATNDDVTIQFNIVNSKGESCPFIK